jgi:hypothetical protein
MRCAKCGSDNREGRKFGAKCATPLARPCPQCGASNEPREDFCGECAATLGNVQAPEKIERGPDSPIHPPLKISSESALLVTLMRPGS